MILRLILLVAVATIILMFFTQFFWPAWNNRKLFPMFRRSNWKINNDIVEANTRQYIAKQRIAAAKEDASAAELEIKAEQEIDEAYDDLIRRVENKN